MFEFSEDLGILKTWMAGQGINLGSIVTERQAAFQAQKLVGTYQKFPPKGQSCRAMLLGLQAVVVRNSTDRRADTSAKPKSAPKLRKTRAKRGTSAMARDGLAIFTFGVASPTPGLGGWAFVAYYDGVEVLAKNGSETGVTKDWMDLEALVYALTFVHYSRGTRPKGCPVRVFNNNADAVGVATKTRRPEQDHAMIDCIHLMIEQMLPGVVIQWCRGHAGEKGNLRVRGLAEQGRLGRVVPA